MEQFMDQVKIIVRFLVTYRFWISVSVAAIFSGVAYLLGSGPVKKQTETATAAIETSAKNVKQFSSPGLPNAQYKPAIDEKTEVLIKDVNAAWRTLYNRQVPLLTWPENVQDDFRKWGRRWPENVDAGTVTIAIVNYADAYPAYIEKLYKICKPYDLVKGEEGVVLAPPAETLLRPAVFPPGKPPDINKVWSTQERHWTQRTLLEVIAAVNKNAKNWDQAIIKQIQEMEVGSLIAQDQRSMAAGDELIEAEPIMAPGAEEEAVEEAAPVGGLGRGRDEDDSFMGGGANAASASVFYIDKGQYKIMPVYLAVLIDQEKIQNLLVELENSPMSVQVMDYEMARPSERVIKPDLEAGIYNSFGSMGMMGGRGMGRRGDMMSTRGFGGGNYGMAGQAGFGARRRGRGDEMGGRGDMMGGGFGGAGMQSPQHGTNLRGVDPKKKREALQKRMEEKQAGPSLFDPYFNIVEVKIYGQARFYNPPPPISEEEPSPGDSEGAPDAAAEPPADAAAAETKAETAAPGE
jgi:hypothetical protein